MTIEVSVGVARFALSDVETFDTVDVNPDKLHDPKYRENLSNRILKAIDDAAHFGSTGEIRTK